MKHKITQKEQRNKRIPTYYIALLSLALINLM